MIWSEETSNNYEVLGCTHMLLNLCRRTAQVQMWIINMKGKQGDHFLNLVAFLRVLLFCNNCAV